MRNNTIFITELSQDRSLKSKMFFKDPIAMVIANGTPYTPLMGNLVVGGKFDSWSFEFKILNALKMLGFNGLLDGIYFTDLLHKFQLVYGLDILDVIGVNCMLRLDQLIYSQERYDSSVGDRFIPISSFKESPLNEPDNNHQAMMFDTFFRTMPDDVTYSGLSRIGFADFVNHWQMRTHVGYLINSTTGSILSNEEGLTLVANQSPYTYCNVGYFNAYYTAGSIIPEINRYVPVRIMTDYNFMDTLIHEYGHLQGYRDNNVYLSFVNISWVSYSVKIRTFDPDEFVSGYSSTLNIEDFAETFNAYVTAGNIFRIRIQNNSYLNQKYQLMKNFLGGREYNTGSVSSYQLWLSNNSGIPFHVSDYMASDPKWIWDNKYPIL